MLDRKKYPRRCVRCMKLIPLSEPATIYERATVATAGKLLCQACGDPFNPGEKFMGSGERVIRNTHGLGG
jgi:hypothetical protein